LVSTTGRSRRASGTGRWRASPAARDAVRNEGEGTSHCRSSPRSR